jgi:hypothetical protein
MDQRLCGILREADFAEFYLEFHMFQLFRQRVSLPYLSDSGHRYWHSLRGIDSRTLHFQSHCIQRDSLKYQKKRIVIKLEEKMVGSYFILDLFNRATQMLYLKYEITVELAESLARRKHDLREPIEVFCGSILKLQEKVYIFEFSQQ